MEKLKLYHLLKALLSLFNLFLLLLSALSMFCFSTHFGKIMRVKSKKLLNNYLNAAFTDKDGMTAQTELLAVKQCHHTLVQNVRWSADVWKSGFGI